MNASQHTPMIPQMQNVHRRTGQFMAKTTALIITLMAGLSLFSAPALALSDMQGKPQKFSDFIGKGQWTVFEVWSSQCPACPDAVFYMNNLKKRYAKAQLIGISVDGDYGAEGPTLAKRFITQHEISFPTLYSSTAEVDEWLGQYSEVLFGTPSVLFFNPQGELSNIEVGAIISQDVIDFIEQTENNSR